MNMNEMSEHAADAATLMKALGNESRLMILCLLADQERSVGELNEMIPLSQSALSQQLARLRADELVSTTPQNWPVMLTANPGSGKVLYLGSDSFWRWRYRACRGRRNVALFTALRHR